jgi:signal transduction histidine kinase/CheY-like chemotaxis protein
VHPDDRQRLRRAARRAVRRGQAYDAEFRIVRPSGELRWCVIGAAPTLDASGRALRLSGVTYDITERKQAEEALQHLNEQLEQRVEERTRERQHALAQLFEAQKIDTIGQLTGGVAHDFNNLLMAVLGSLELLKKRLPDDPRAKRLLDNALQGAERGAALTQRLLAFARRQELKPEAVDVATLVDGMDQLLERALGPSVLMRKSIPAGLAPVRVDANQLELALLNLAVNARDAMPIGGSLTIVARAETVFGESGPPELRPGDYVRISVTDTGIGMDEDTLSKATQPFFTTKGPGRGTGLGLSMVHGLAAQSGGMVQLSSKPGNGTTIDLWLPQAERDAFARSGAGERRAVEPLAQPCTVLVVDDDALVCTGTAAMLEDLGHTVIETSSGAEALEILRSERRVDIVITDHAMPGMTGLELAQHAGLLRPGLSVVLATGYAEFPESAGPASSLPRLSKPFRQEELAATLAEFARPVPPASGNVVPLRRSESASH